MVYPWQTKAWNQLWGAYSDQRLPHALLFRGIKGIGKTDFAREFARALLCQQQTLTHHCDVSLIEAKKACHACQMAFHHVHPHLLTIQPEKEGQGIKVDQVRAITEFTQSIPQGELAVILILQANKMNVNAANALLKTLEEPPLGTILLLVNEQGEFTPATINSRCLKITFNQPLRAEALTWLQTQYSDKEAIELALSVAQGSPLLALQLIKDGTLALRETLLTALGSLLELANPIQLAAPLHKADNLSQLIEFMLSWMLDLLRLKFGGDTATLSNYDYSTALKKTSVLLSARQINSFIEWLLQGRASLMKGMNVNKQLLIEALLIRWQALFQLKDKAIG